ncbi:protein of unknown function [Amycolatopsis arida]|uniref:Fibronectin type-III domain-containing protein n=2 Tax=Amycolatopsis arida TaxID=587909 RepID=A0A1I5Z6U2_9PSEU|nr:beta-propeller uncharacterized protein DUF5122 [Amycolatopsis arida]SFQ52183.1 protein of unknown function [Amycolatopsis arida]
MIAVVAATATTAALAAHPAAPARAAEPALPPTVTAGAMPTPQTDGIVFTVAIVGDVVYAGGRFTRARPAGAAPGGPGEVPRTNLMAFDVRTGELLPWAPAVSGSVFTSATDPGPFCRQVGTQQYVCDTVFRIEAAPDRRTIYVGGDFDKIDGQWRSRIAAFDAVTGVLDTGFRPRVAGRVRGISVTADTVYLGGGFRSVDGVARGRLAAVGRDGTLRPWAPTADGEVFAVLAAPEHGRVLLGGAFRTVNGEARSAMMAVDATGGANVPWQARVPEGREVVTDIATDGEGTAYFGAYHTAGGGPRFEGRAAIAIADGTPRWWDGCYGDTQSVAVAGGVVYAASHTHDCSAIGAAPENGPIDYYRLTAETAAAVRTAPATVNHVRAGDPIPEFLPWFPGTNSGPADSHFKNGPWAVDADGRYVVVGGEFTTVNGRPQQGLVRFAVRGVPGAVNKGPQTPFRAPTLSRENGTTGSPVIRWTTTWDGQNSEIRYEVMRVGRSTPLHAVEARSRPWELPQLSYVDREVDSGTYWIRAVDADGERIGSPQASIG